jgi:hypothetical protein
MPAGIWNLVFGLAAVAAGLSGKFTLIGTAGSSGQYALAGVGGLLACYGLYQIVTSRKK